MDMDALMNVTRDRLAREEEAAKNAKHNAARRVAKELQAWRGHILAPASRKADRQKTFDAIVLNVLDAVCDFDTAERNQIIAQFFPQHWKNGTEE